MKKRGRKPLSHRTDLDHDSHHCQGSPTDLLTSGAQSRQYSFVGPARSPSQPDFHESAHNDEAYQYAITNTQSAYGNQQPTAGYPDSPIQERDDDLENRHRPPDHPVRRISQIINPPLPNLNSHNDSQRAAVVLQHMAAPRPLPAQQSSEPVKHKDCRYKCLEPIVPLLEGIIEPKTACDLLEFYFAEPDSALFRHASPYVLSPVIRKRSLLHPTNPRQTTAALLVTILWTTAQTCDLPLLLLPGRRGQICEQLRIVAMALVHERDRDHWHRALGIVFVSIALRNC